MKLSALIENLIFPPNVRAAAIFWMRIFQIRLQVRYVPGAEYCLKRKNHTSAQTADSV